MHLTKSKSGGIPTLLRTSPILPTASERKVQKHHHSWQGLAFSGSCSPPNLTPATPLLMLSTLQHVGPFHSHSRLSSFLPRGLSTCYFLSKAQVIWPPEGNLMATLSGEGHPHGTFTVLYPGKRALLPTPLRAAPPVPDLRNQYRMMVQRWVCGPTDC